jgi:hypothetical protein
MIEVNPLHQNDMKNLACQLGLTTEEFDSLLTSANSAYDLIRDLGPFYGQEGMKDPTFRITAKPVVLPKSYKKTLEELGNDLLYVAKALPKLSPNLKKKLGNNLDFRIPPTWRVDAIWDTKGRIKMNELEGVDSASALMVVEQLAYNLQDLKESTLAKLVPTLKAMCKVGEKQICRIALIRINVSGNPHTPNALRLIDMIEKLSEGKIRIDLFDEAELKEGKVKVDFTKYNGVLNETLLSPTALKRLGVKDEQRLSGGNYNVIGNKGVFALIFDKNLEEFWLEQIGKQRLERLQKVLIPTRFIENESQLKQAKGNKEVVKVSWSSKDMALMNRSKGVAIPEGDIEQASEQRWELLSQLLKQGVQLIAQEFVKPRKVSAYLRKKGTNLEPVKWYNRVCLKYVSLGDPNIEDLVPEVAMTAIEVTIGPDIIPSGRKCAFTAGTFAQ